MNHPAPAGDSLGDEIHEIFAEEFDEIITSFQTWIPQWVSNPADHKLLTEIRRGFHTLKGSGRMIGRYALGDYAWAHENALNKALEGQLPRNEPLFDILTTSLATLRERRDFFLHAVQSDDAIRQSIFAIEQLLDGVESPAESREEVPANKRIHLRIDEREESRIVWEMFREELPEQLQTIDRLMQTLYESPDNREACQSLERELHTLKGGARMAQLMDMGDAAHQAEELLTGMVRGAGADTQAQLEALQVYLDKISELAEQHSLSAVPVTEFTEPESDSVGNASALDKQPSLSFLNASHSGVARNGRFDSFLEKLLVEQAANLPDIQVLSGIQQSAHEQAEQATEEGSALLLGQEQIRLSATFLDKMVEAANVLHIQQNSLGERLQSMSEDVGEFGRTASRLKQLLRSLELETEAQIHAGYRHSGVAASQSRDFDPLEMDQYSEIQRLSRALAESLNDLMNIEGDLTNQLRGAERFVKESQLNSRELHHDLLATRLIEVSVVMPRLRRILRQTATELERKVNLEVSGEDLKLDRNLLQQMTAPIEHVLRNAVSHGIESVEVREQAGKPAIGLVTLQVAREDTEIVFRVTDDGSGLNREKIRAKAVELGLIGPNDVLTRQEIQRLILRPGFSTADQVSQISGRGVGMDVVNSEIKAMGGNLLIDSEQGKGTEFTIRLPFALAANPVLFVDVQDQSYAIPMGCIQGLARVSTDTLRTHLGHDKDPLIFHDESYRLHYLGAALGHERAMNISDDSMFALIYTRVNGHCMAWVVDAIQGRRDVVMQSLGALFKQCHFYSAATITSEGQVVMVPDMLDLIERMLQSPKAEKPEAEDQSQAAPRRHERPHIMIVDDSITVRKVTEKLLLHENYVVETARDGLEALEKLNSFEPDLMLLDIEMPRMDGFEVLSAVRNSRWKAMPVVMISSRTADKHRQHAFELGATDFLGKPYQNQDLLAHIQRLVEHEWNQQKELI